LVAEDWPWFPISFESAYPLSLLHIAAQELISDLGFWIRTEDACRQIYIQQKVRAKDSQFLPIPCNELFRTIIGSETFALWLNDGSSLYLAFRQSLYYFVHLLEWMYFRDHGPDYSSFNELNHLG